MTNFTPFAAAALVRAPTRECARRRILACVRGRVRVRSARLQFGRWVREQRVPSAVHVKM
jgi:hypothetical protein